MRKHNPRHAVVRAVRSLSWRGRIAAIVAPLAVLAMGGLALSAGAGAATSVCSHRCIDIYSAQFGPHHIVNRNNNGKVRLRDGSNHFTNEDITVTFGGVQQVKTFEAAGLIPATSYAFLHYPNDLAAELEFSPDSNDSGMCMGVASAAFSGEGVTAVPCGVDGRSLWIFDPVNGHPVCFIPGHLCPMINGSNANFSQPQVLTAPEASNQLQVQAEHINGGVAQDNQQFSYRFGPYTP